MSICIPSGLCPPSIITFSLTNSNRACQLVCANPYFTALSSISTPFFSERLYYFQYNRRIIRLIFAFKAKRVFDVSFQYKSVCRKLRSFAKSQIRIFLFTFFLYYAAYFSFGYETTVPFSFIMPHFSSHQFLQLFHPKTAYGRLIDISAETHDFIYYVCCIKSAAHSCFPAQQIALFLHKNIRMPVRL